MEKNKCKIVLLILAPIGNRYYYEQTFGYRLGIIHLFGLVAKNVGVKNVHFFHF